MTSKNDLVVVTGAGGFIGGHLVRVLQQRGHTKIRAVDVKPLNEWYQKTPGVENQVGDLALLEPCRAAAKGARMIYNLAADMGGMGFIETHKAECMLSVLVSTHMLVAAKEAGTERFFYSSSACVYNGDKQTRADVTALRRQANGVTATTFFHDQAGRPWKDADGFRDAFNELRDRLAKKHGSFETRYYVGVDPGDPLRLPTKKLTMRTMRHTCITLNHDAGVPRELIRAITGHELDTIDQVLKCYAAVTADQAAAAPNIRLAYEAEGRSA